VRLTDEIVKSLRTIFAREDLITHGPNVIRFNRPRKQKSEIKERQFSKLPF
jgi:hypothetical protein